MVFVPHLHRRFSKEQIQELKREINKTEYEKAREPLIGELSELEWKVFRLEKVVQEYQSIITDILNSIENDYLKILYRDNPVEVKLYSAKDINVANLFDFKEVEIPIKQGIRNHIRSRIIEVCRKERN